MSVSLLNRPWGLRFFLFSFLCFLYLGVFPVHAVPIANFNITPTSGAVPIRIFLDASNASPSGGATITKYEWNSSGGQGILPRKVSSVYLTRAGSYTFTLTVTDSSGAQANSTKQIMVGGTPTTPTTSNPDARFTLFPTQGTAPLRISLDATASQASNNASITTYQWQVNPAVASGLTGVTPTATLTQPGQYQITLTVTDTQGKTDSATRTVTVNSAPNPGPEPTTPLQANFIASPSSGSAPLTVSLNASQSTGNITSYLWQSSDGKTASGASTIMTFNQSATVTLTVRDSTGATANAQRPITVIPTTPTIPLNAIFTTNPSSGTAPLQVFLNANQSTGNIISYSWRSSDGQSASGKSTVMTMTQSATITLTVRDNTGRSDSSQQTVTINQPVSVAPTAQFTATPSTGIMPLTVTLNGSGSSAPNSNIDSYQWVSSDGQTANTPTTSMLFTQAGVYTIQLTIVNSQGLSDTLEQTITVLPEVVSFTVKPFLGSRTLYAVASSTIAQAKYIWQVDGIQQTDNTTPYLIKQLTNDGTYQISLMVEAQGTQTTPYQEMVTVKNRFPPIPHFTITPDIDSGLLHLDGTASYDPDGGEILLYQWSSDGEEFAKDNTGTTQFRFPTNRSFALSLRITDNENIVSEATAWGIVNNNNELDSTVVAYFPISQRMINGGDVPYTLEMDASNSFDPQGHKIASYEWFLASDLACEKPLETDILQGDTQTAVTTLKITQAGKYNLCLLVTNENGKVSPPRATGFITLTNNYSSQSLGTFEGANFYGGVLINDSFLVNGNAFSDETMVDIVTHVEVAPEHLNQAADVLNVFSYTPMGVGIPLWFTKTQQSDLFLEWDLNPNNLEPIKQFISLPSTFNVEIFSGQFLDLPGEYEIYLGYRLNQSGEIMVNPQPITFKVINK